MVDKYIAELQIRAAFGAAESFFNDSHPDNHSDSFWEEFIGAWGNMVKYDLELKQMIKLVGWITPPNEEYQWYPLKIPALDKSNVMPETPEIGMTIHRPGLPDAAKVALGLKPSPATLRINKSLHDMIEYRNTLKNENAPMIVLIAVDHCIGLLEVES